VGDEVLDSWLREAQAPLKIEAELERRGSTFPPSWAEDESRLYSSKKWKRWMTMEMLQTFQDCDTPSRRMLKNWNCGGSLPCCVRVAFVVDADEV